MLGDLFFSPVSVTGHSPFVAVRPTLLNIDSVYNSVTTSLTVETFTKYLARLLYQANEEGRNRVAQQDLCQFRPKGEVGGNRR